MIGHKYAHRKSGAFSLDMSIHVQYIFEYYKCDNCFMENSIGLKWVDLEQPAQGQCNMSLDVRKPVFGICEQQRCRPAHPPSQISTLVIRLLKSIISRLAKSKISIFKQISVAKQAG